MNAFGFFVARIAWQVGIRRERARWAAVTRESQMLAETQDMLGRMAWPHMENVEMVSGEYWQLRDCHDQQDELRTVSERLTRESECDQERVYKLEDALEDEIEALRQQKQTVVARIADFNDAVAGIKRRDAETRRRFGSLKTKLDVLKKQTEGGYEMEIEKTRATLSELKDAHTGNLKEIEALEGEIKTLEEKGAAMEEEILNRRAGFREETAELTAALRQRAKQISEISAKIGAIETRKNELAFEIGLFLSHHMDERPDNLRPILKRFGPLVGRIRQLRSSIRFNQRLARRTGR